jgi:hypothetical protein
LLLSSIQVCISFEAIFRELMQEVDRAMASLVNPSLKADAHTYAHSPSVDAVSIDADDTESTFAPSGRVLLRIRMAQAEARTECPACGNSCEATVIVCPVCFTPRAVRSKAALVTEATAPVGIRLTDDAFLDPALPLVFEIGAERLVLPLEDTLVIGRRSLIPGDAGPRVDIKIVQGKEFGMSRQHARLTRLGGLVYITDLGSVNGTFLNGHQLPPRFSRLLHDGDDVLLGRLKVRVRFDK